MSIVVRFPPSNVTRQQYDSVRNALTESGDCPPDGCQLHVLFGDDNDVRVSEIWESREKLDAFGQKLMPRPQEAGIRLSGEPETLRSAYPRDVLGAAPRDLARIHPDLLGPAWAGRIDDRTLLL